MKFKLIGIAVIAAMGLVVTACDNEKSDNTSMFLMMAKARSDSQAKTAAVSNSFSGSMSSAVGAGSMTAYNKTMEQQKMMVAILNNGNDPVFAKQAVTEYIAQQRMEKATPKAQLAAFSATLTDSGAGYKTFTFSGDIPGVGVTTATYDIPLFCSIQVNAPSGTRGTLTFGGGSTLTWTGNTGNPTNFTGSCEMNTTLTYNDFGFMYVDYLTIVKLIKSPMISISAICDAANSFAKYGVIESGSIVAGLTANYTASNANNAFASKADLTVSLNSPAGIVFYPNGDAASAQTLVLENVYYTYNSNITVTEAADLMHSVTGSLTVEFTGTVNGNSIDETIAINL
jgi:hypothetical protein